MAGRGRVLIVEDEPALRMLLERYFARTGREAVSTATAEDAWSLTETDRSRFDAFLIDLTLPGASGAELAREILRVKPGAAIVVTSGYPFDIGTIDPEGTARVAFLPKPFPPSELAGLFDRLLGD